MAFPSGAGSPGRARGDGVIWVCFFLSGGTSLVYQVVWLRMLALVFGHTVYAITAVLAAFMAGLALGSFLLSRYAARLRDPIRAYGWLEIGVGLSCAAVPLLLRGVAHLYLGLHQALGPSYGTFGVVQFALVLCLLLLPTTLMGGTLPVLAQALARDERGLRGTVGGLYAVNTFGAVLGVVWAGYLALPELGTRTTSLAAVVANVVVGLLALAWSRVRSARTAVGDGAAEALRAGASEPSRAWRIPRGLGAWLTVAALGISGAISMIYEVAWTRALALIMGSSTYAFSAMLVAFLLGIAGGSALFSWMWSRRDITPATFAGIQIGVAASTAAVVVLFERVPELFVLGLAWSLAPPFVQVLQLAVSVACLLPAALFIGATFPCAVAVAGRGAASVGRDVGRVFAVNTLGAIAGALVGGLVLVPAFGVQTALEIGIGGNLALAAVLFLGAARPVPVRAWIGAGAALLAGSATFQLAPWDPRVMTSGPGIYASWHYISAAARGNLAATLRSRDLLFYRDGLSSTVSVDRVGDNVLLRVNGKVDASSTGDMPTQLMLGHLPMLVHPDPRRVLVIGLGGGITAAAVTRYPVERLDIVEIEPAVVEASRFLSHVNGDVLGDPRVRLVIADARNFLLTTSERYDVIISEPSNPWISGIAPLFTVEFFELARRRLRPGGIMTQWTHAYGLVPADLRMIVRTFQKVFPAASVWQPLFHDLLLLGRTATGPIDLRRLAARYEASGGVQRDLARCSVGGWPGLFGLLALGEGDTVRYAAGGMIHTDDELQLEFSAPRTIYLDTGSDNDGLLRQYRSTEFPDLTGVERAELDTVQGRYWLGQASARRRAMAEAVAHYRRALDGDPTHVPSLLGLSTIMFEIGSYEEAFGAAQKALAREPRHGRALYLAGVSASALGRRDLAIRLVGQAVTAEPANHEYRDQLTALTDGTPTR